MGVIKKEKCPLCDLQLYERYEGLVCKNPKCKMYHKLDVGWVLITGCSKWSIKRQQINSFYTQITRRRLQKDWVEKKIEILRRDDYTCVKCNESLNYWDYKPILHVHHIVPASEEMALFFDNDNLITLCEDCHNEVHSLDKNKFNNK